MAEDIINEGFIFDVRAEGAEKEVQIKVTLDPSTGSSGAPTLSTSIPSCIIAFNLFDKIYTRVMSQFLLPFTTKE
jgi:hypothetical protein